MILNTYLPTEKLSPFISKYLIIECADERVNRVLPGTAPVMAFRFSGSVHHIDDNQQAILPQAMISGLRKSGRLISYGKQSGNILVIFREGGAHAILREPVHELFEESISVGDLKGFKDVAGVEAQLQECTQHNLRITILEQYLLSKLYNDKPDHLILKAMTRIHATRGSIRMKELADILCISQDAFEKRFRKVVGVSPKQFAYLVRMRAVIDSGKLQSLTSLAVNAGYFDQSHFNKDFKIFTGQTPGDYFRSPVLW